MGRGRTKPKISKSKRKTILESRAKSTGGSTNLEYPAFCFNEIQKSYGLDDCNDNDDRISFANKIVKLGSMTWSQIQSAPRHGLGFEQIDKNSIKASLPNNTPPDRTFLAFRLGGSKNKVILGYREDRLFHVVWIDTKGSTYKH